MSSETWKQENDNDSFSKFRERSMTSVKKNSETALLRTFPSSISHRDVNAKANSVVATFLQENASPSSDEVVAKHKHKRIENTEQSMEGKSHEEFSHEARAISADNHGKNAAKSDSATSLHCHATQENELREDTEQIYDRLASMVNIEEKKVEMAHIPEKRFIGNVSEDVVGGQAIVMREKSPVFPLTSSKKVENVKSVRKNGSVEATEDIYDGGKESKVELSDFSDECKMRIEIPYASKKKGELGAVIEPKTELQDCRDEWKTTIEMLREELREAAATEVGLYSIVAEHASSVNKVHTPARRLSRFYIDACKAGSQAKRASAARAVVSGLILVSKSCGHDVPR